MNDTAIYTYYEYADDLLARMPVDAEPGDAFEFWVGGKWKRSLDLARFSMTAQKIADVDAYRERNPSRSIAF